MSSILQSHQITFLATYLSVADYNSKKVIANSDGMTFHTHVQTPEEIASTLDACKTKEELYEYLEDYGHLNDPWFDIVLNLLL